MRDRKRKIEMGSELGRPKAEILSLGKLKFNCARNEIGGLGGI